MDALKTLETELYGRWSPALRLAGVALVAAATIYLYWDMHYGFTLLGRPESREDEAMQVILQLGSQMTAPLPLLMFAVAYLFPALERRQARSPMVIEIDNNRLVLKGQGRLAGKYRVVTLGSGQAFSTDTLLVNNPHKLEAAISHSLAQLRIRVRPLVVVMPCDQSRDRPLTSEQAELLEKAIYGAGACKVVVVDGTSRSFNHQLPEMFQQKERA